MPRVVPAPRRSFKDSIPGGVRVVIPARGRWFAMLFLGAWLVGWAFGEVMAARLLLFGSGAPRVFLLVWLSLWTAGGAFAIATLAWSLAGREVVTVTRGLLAIRREVFGIGRTWEYDAQQVHNLRVSPAGFDPFTMAASFRFWGFSGGPMAFDYGARTSRFGAGVDEAEAASIVSEIREWLPRSA